MHLLLRSLSLIIFFLACLRLSYGEELAINREWVKMQSIAKTLEAEEVRLARAAADLDLMLAKAFFDVRLNAAASHQIDHAEQPFTVFGTASNTTLYNLGLASRLPSGTALSLDWGNVRDSNNSPFASFNPTFASDLTVGLRQPLAHNSFGTIDRGRVQEVSVRLKGLDENLKNQLQSIMLSHLTRYDDYREAYEQHRLDQRAVETADRILKINETKSALGLVETEELLALKANKILRQGQGALSHGLMESARLSLATPLAVSDYQLLPEQETPVKMTADDLNVLMARALDQRGDYQRLRRELEADDIKIATQKNVTWPEVDLVSSLRLNGVSQNYTDALGHVGDPNPDFLLGLQLSVPLWNRQAKGELAKARTQKLLRLLELKRLERDIIGQIKGALNLLASGQERLRSGENLVTLQQQKLEVEIAKFGQGRLSSDIVIRGQDDLIEAERVRLKAKIDLWRAATGLEAALGELLGTP